MAHELEIIDGRAAFLGREDAWHHLGTVIGRSFTWDDVVAHTPTVAMEVTKVALQDMLVLNEVPSDMHAIVRDDSKVLAVVGNQYEAIQANEMYEFGSALQGLGAGDLQSVCSLREGRQYAFTYDQGTSEVAGERFQHYLSIVGSHDGSMPNLALRSSIVVVCANTMAAAISNGVDRITLRHTRNVRDRMDQAVQVAAAARRGVTAFEERVAQVQSVRLTTRDFNLFLDGLFPLSDEKARTKAQHERAREAVRSLFVAPLTSGFENSGWAFVQSVNSYEQWNAPIRNAKGVASQTTRAIRQFDSIVKGGQPLTAKAFEMALSLT